ALSASKRVRVASRRVGDTLQVVVQDSGPALSEGRLESLFDPASAATPEALGLPVAQLIARQHGGRLSVRSQEGLGNAFLLELPCLPAPEAPAMPATPPGLKGRRALVVDDESFLLECLCDALTAWGVETVACGRGEEAVQQMGGAAFDFIVSDIRMPGLSGMDLFDWLKANRPDMVSRILFTTGDAFDAQTRQFLEGNAVPHLGKPFDLRQLKRSLETLLVPSAEA
ncbi:MAG TPA: hybrid sensor histidine kinase/response regulator, partial [Holophagaceae bacterium]